MTWGPEDDSCRVCGGRRTVVFPLKTRYPAGVSFVNEPPAQTATFETKAYPCPECSTPSNKVAVVQGRVTVSHALTKVPGTEGPILHQAAESLLRFLIDEKLLTLKTTRHANGEDWVATVELGVVTENFQELRAAFVKNEVCDAVTRVADKAIAEIKNWGSASNYADHRIEKSMATGFIDEAMRKVLDK